MKHRCALICAIIALVGMGTLAVGCGAALTSAGQTVEYQMQGEAPEACQYIGDVANESDWDPPASLQDAKTDLRNRAGALGGNYLVIDTIEARPGAASPERTFYVGTGRAYSCEG